MEIWIILDGEKAGPFQDYEIRRKISLRDFTADTPGWHEGLEKWLPLAEIPIFKDEFTKPLPTEQKIPSGPKPPPPPLPPVYGRRLFARLFDLQLYSVCWWLILWAGGKNLTDAMVNPIVTLAQFLPWFAIEAILLHKYGTTPGKWLLGIRVANIDQSPITQPASIRRALRVLVAGIGFGWSILPLCCVIMSYFVAKRFGNALWDFAGGHRVFSQPLRAWRVVLLCVVYLLAAQFQMMILYPWIPQDQLNDFGETFPAWKEQLDKNPPWHLPKRGE